MSSDHTSPLQNELALAQRLAREAGAWAIRQANSATPREKANRSFVTDVDLEVESRIRHALREAFPQDALSGEELATTGGLGKRRWSIDPIDGTGNFVWGLPLWAVSIALIDEDDPILGVIYIPPLDELFWAIRDQGAFLNDFRLTLADAGDFHPQDNFCVSTNALRALDPRTLPGRIRDLGSACCEQAFVAAGRLHGCTFLGEAEHDLAAGALIAWEAGARVARLDHSRPTLARLLAETPVPIPTFIATPERLSFLTRHARRLGDHI
jgi:myo-inositol-1(or 4)-monophosphatase